MVQKVTKLQMVQKVTKLQIVQKVTKLQIVQKVTKLQMVQKVAKLQMVQVVTKLCAREINLLIVPAVAEADLKEKAICCDASGSRGRLEGESNMQ